ncbi:FBXO15 [Bugula neritina]|uniref:FBXO15 n=1 Tax=Bugula neritina TaxID=10212 RepID=A0A7J7K5H5_BUGNE|nr:FBXO15 [Bugula neritina]
MSAKSSSGVPKNIRPMNARKKVGLSGDSKVSATRAVRQRKAASPRTHTSLVNGNELIKKTNNLKISELVERLSDEILILLFSYLDAGDLLVAARVCRRWLCVSNDNMLWQSMYRRCLLKTKAGKDIGIPLDTPTLFWKKKCIEKSVEFRNSRAQANLNSIDPFTTLPKQISGNLQQLGVKFTLAFYNGRGTHHYITHNDCFYHRMAVSARWHSLGNLPDVSRLHSLKLLALNPVFYDQKGIACKNSPCQRSLLEEIPFSWSKLTSVDPIGSDSMVDLYLIHPGVVMAAWKNGGGMAFISANFHYNKLIDRCLCGTFNTRHVGSAGDSLSSIHGFFDYNATVELRNQRQTIWSQQFRNIHAINQPGGARYLDAINESDLYSHPPLEKPIQFLWISGPIKNKTEKRKLTLRFGE